MRAASHIFFEQTHLTIVTLARRRPPSARAAEGGHGHCFLFFIFFRRRPPSARAAEGGHGHLAHERCGAVSRQQPIAAHVPGVSEFLASFTSILGHF
jgi:hypothetical protein